MALDLMRPIVQSWLAVIQKSREHKREEFQDDAEECMRFFDGPHNFMYETYVAVPGIEDNFPRPHFRMTYNVVAEMVQLFGPSLYHRNPYRQVNAASRPQMPMDQLRPELQQAIGQMMAPAQSRAERASLLSTLLGDYLNYTPNELDLRGQSRMVIDEALIKGCGVWWTNVYTPPGSDMKMVGSFYDTVDNLFVDPDMETIEDAKWCARQRTLPRWEVERRFGLKSGTLRGNLESFNQQSQVYASEDYPDAQKKGDTNDLVRYYEVYSRMGVGHRLRNAYAERISPLDRTLGRFGDYVFLAIADNYPWPLNLPESVINGASVREAFLRTQWPTPYWADPADAWPFTSLAFHKRPRKVWPMSHVTPALGELRFLNWAFSFMADKIKNTSRDFIGIMRSASEELKTAILSGKDLTLLEIESTHGKTVQDVVSFLQHPNFNGDVYRVIDTMMVLLRDRLGLNELMYGESRRQLRSASEAQIKGDQIRIRPDDMAEQVEDAMTRIARKEALCCRWHLEPQDVMPILGQERAMLWGQVVQNSDIAEVVYELDYRIEAGSIRKPNKNRDRENAVNAMQSLVPLLLGYYQASGDPNPINAAIEMFTKAFDMPQDRFKFQPPPPPQPDPTKMLDAQIKQQEAQTKLQMEAAKEQQKIQSDVIKGRQSLAIDAASHEQESQQKWDEHLLDMLMKRAEHHLEMQQQREEGTLALQLARQAATANQSSNGSQ